MTPVATWLLAGQLVLDLVLVALLGVITWKARTVADTLVRTAAGTEWATGKLAEVFGSAATSVELSANAAAASCVAIQTLTRDLRPVLQAQPDDQLHATIDISRLTDPDD